MKQFKTDAKESTKHQESVNTKIQAQLQIIDSLNEKPSTGGGEEESQEQKKADALIQLMRIEQEGYQEAKNKF